MSEAVRSVHLADPLKSYLVDIAETSRAHQGLDARAVATSHAAARPGHPVPGGGQRSRVRHARRRQVGRHRRARPPRRDPTRRGVAWPHGRARDPRGARRRAGSCGALSAHAQRLGCDRARRRRVHRRPGLRHHRALRAGRRHRRRRSSSPSSRCRRRPPRLAVRRLVEPSTVQAGDAARVDIQVANAGVAAQPGRAAVGAGRQFGRRHHEPRSASATRALDRRLSACRRWHAGVVRVGPDARAPSRRAGPGVADVRHPWLERAARHAAAHAGAVRAGRLVGPAGRPPATEGAGSVRQRVPLAARVRAGRRPAPDQLEGVGAVERADRQGDGARGCASAARSCSTPTPARTTPTGSSAPSRPPPAWSPVLPPRV